MPSNRDSTGAAAVPASPSLRKSYPTHASDYELKEEIGQGATATCWKAKCLPLNEIVAVKCLDLEKCNSSLVSSSAPEAEGCCSTPIRALSILVALLLLRLRSK